jgi:hypothetical protein
LFLFRNRLSFFPPFPDSCCFSPIWLILLPWRWTQQVPLKHWYLFTRLHSVTSETIILICTGVRTSDLMQTCTIRMDHCCYKTGHTVRNVLVVARHWTIAMCSGIQTCVIL